MTLDLMVIEDESNGEEAESVNLCGVKAVQYLMYPIMSPSGGGVVQPDYNNVPHRETGQFPGKWI